MSQHMKQRMTGSLSVAGLPDVGTRVINEKRREGSMPLQTLLIEVGAKQKLSIGIPYGAWVFPLLMLHTASDISATVRHFLT